MRPRGLPGRRTGRRLVRAAVALAVVVSSTVIGGPADRAGAALLAYETFNRTAGPLGPVTVIGDSVLMGSVLYGPALSDHLASRGWGPIRVRAGLGYSSGYFDVTTEARSSYWIDRWRAEGWDAPNVVVNLGTNDSGFCGTDLACARAAVLHLVNAIGPGHRIWWAKVTRHPALANQQNTWNLALEQIAAERDDFFTWDWPGVMASGPYPSSDGTHLSPDGYRLRSQVMALEITADLALATRAGTAAPLPSPSGPRSELVPVGPIRIIDTRRDPPGRVAARSQIVVDVSDEVPSGTTAIAAYVSATRTGGDGYLTAYECSTGRPLASSANYRRGETRGAVAITPISARGRFCLYTHAEADLLVDLQAAFVPVGSGGARLTALATPRRLVDTRVSGRRQIVEVAVPAGASAAAISVTAIRSTRPGFLTAYPCTAEVPTIATVNHLPGEVISGAAFVPVSGRGTICLYSLADAHVTVDLTGVFSAGGALVFEPATPTRTIDTRDGTGGWRPIHGSMQTIDARVAPARAEAVSGTLTIVSPLRPGYLVAWGCGAGTDTANVTALPGQVLANSVTTGASPDGRLCVRARNATQTVFDTTGWWVP